MAAGWAGPAPTETVSSRAVPAPQALEGVTVILWDPGEVQVTETELPAAADRVRPSDRAQAAVAPGAGAGTL